MSASAPRGKRRAHVARIERARARFPRSSATWAALRRLSSVKAEVSFRRAFHGGGGAAGAAIGVASGGFVETAGSLGGKTVVEAGGRAGFVAMVGQTRDASSTWDFGAEGRETAAANPPKAPMPAQRKWSAPFLRMF